jgi:FkbM family methyltransferase
MNKQTILNILKSNKIGRQILLNLRFLRKIPDYYIEHLCQSDYFESGEWHGSKIIVPNRKTRDYYIIYSPDVDKMGSHIRTYNIFRHHATAFYTSKENELFIKYAKGKSTFLDIGAAEGYFSALFASINQTPCNIYSIDCGSSSVHKHLYLTRDMNLRFYPQHEWEIIYAYVSSVEGKSNQLHWLDQNCPIVTIEELCRNSGIIPDLIKMDIESFEYEAILGSINFLQENKPTIILELHNKILEERGIQGNQLLDALKSIGYSISDSDCKNYITAPNPHIILT